MRTSNKQRSSWVLERDFSLEPFFVVWMMELVRMAGVDNDEYFSLVAEIECLRERKQSLKESVMEDRAVEEFKAYLVAQSSLLDKFDGEFVQEVR